MSLKEQKDKLRLEGFLRRHWEQYAGKDQRAEGRTFPTCPARPTRKKSDD